MPHLASGDVNEYIAMKAETGKRFLLLLSFVFLQTLLTKPLSDQSLGLKTNERDTCSLTIGEQASCLSIDILWLF